MKKHVKLVTVSAVAAHFGVRQSTVYNWIYKGYIKTLPTLDKHTKGMQWMILWPQRRPKVYSGPDPRYPIAVTRITK